jgi:hypothetical protein
MNEEHKQSLVKMAQRCGDYPVLKSVAENAKEACRTDYAENDEAVIHRDLASLEAILTRAASPVSSGEVTEDDRKALATMARWYGTYKVVQTLAAEAKEASRTNDAGNESAVAPRDAVLLDAAVERMKGNHFLRVFDNV